MKRKHILTLAFVLLWAAVPSTSRALTIMEIIRNSPEALGVTAKSYLVIDKTSGHTLLSKDSSVPWVPASLTKLVTALVVLDANPNFNQAIAMVKADEVGGARIYTKTGVKYKVGDLFYASLTASANNATNALARSAGVPMDEFVKRMNQKARDLGAVNTVFYEPTGIDERNITTAEDYSKITQAAFSNPKIRQAAITQSYSFKATNNSRYSHKIKNTNQLLGDDRIQMVGGKTGYLHESQYNFATELKDRFSNEFIIVLLGSQSSSTQFSEIKKLVDLGGLTKAFSFFAPQVLGTSTPAAN